MNYTLSDLFAVGAAFVLFGLFAFAPGYTFGWLSNAFRFRQRRLATRLAAAVPLSIGLTPIVGYYLWRWWLPAVWVVFGACGAACAVLLARDLRAHTLRLTRPGKIVLAIAAGWLVAGALLLVDLQIGNRLYFSFVSYDYATRAAFTAALSRGGIPPHNPFFFAGQPAPLRYHYFWLIPCSLVDQLGGALVSARQSLIAGTLWCGLGLLGTIALYLRFFQSKGSDQIERRTLIAVSLLAITGLDVLPTLLIDYSSHILLPSVEYWNNQIDAWATTAMWEPHHLSALVAGLTGFLLAWDAARQSGRRAAFVGVLGAGLAFASAAGASVYVTAAVAAGCALWLAIALARRWWRHAVVLGAAGVLAAALALPFLIQVTEGSGGSEASSPASLVRFTVRSFTLADNLVRPGSPAKTLALNAALLPLNYFLEFGFFFVVACLVARRVWRQGLRDQAEWGAIALAAASLLICTFLESTVISSNDLGWRSVLVLQFILLLWAAELWHEGALGIARRPAGKGGPAAPGLVAVLLVLGALGSVYELGLERTFPILSDSTNVQRYSILALDHQLGRRTLALRQAYEALDRLLPASAVVQHNPEDGIGNIPAALYSDRQMAADTGDCGTVFGGSATYCNAVILPRLKRLFNGRQPVTSEQAADTCREFNIAALLFKDTDPVWRDPSSWIWQAQPLLANGFVRVVACAAPPSPP